VPTLQQECIFCRAGENPQMVLDLLRILAHNSSKFKKKKKPSGESRWQDVAQSMYSLLGVWHVPRFQPSHRERWVTFLPSMLQQGLYFFFLPGLSYHSPTLMNVVAWPGWERVCPLGKSRWLRRRGHFATSMRDRESCCSMARCMAVLIA
jgi:hypothetical protein